MRFITMLTLGVWKEREKNYADFFFLSFFLLCRHHLVELCERPSPSFVVQQLIANTRDAPQLEMHYAELRDSWPVLLSTLTY